VVNDVLRRLLELEFGPGKVKHVRNLTDVDDKTIRRAREENRPLAEVTKQWTDKFHADCDALNCLRPHVEPAATTHIKEQVDMIDVLMHKGNAYRAADGSVYFKVSSFDGYGALSRVKERELQLGSALAGKVHAADADEKEDVSDFALWKAHKPEDGDNAWESPWGRGRPGWHIECSAMSKKHLGDTIDLHTGGVDLLFPHHENEIAQSQCCNGTTFANHWYHSEHLLVDGKKMSKSLGNLYTLDDLKAKGVSPMALRLTLLSGHPRKQLNFTLESLHGSESALGTMRKVAGYLAKAADLPEEKLYDLEQIKKHASEDEYLFKDALSSIRDELNTPEAMGAMFVSLHVIATNKGEKTGSKNDLLAFYSFGKLLYALGIDLRVEKVSVPAEITALAEKRWAAKAAKDFKAADTLRAELAAAGWSMLDRKDGYSLEPLKK
jgi:cysteinyl-tRNA synthetase